MSCLLFCVHMGVRTVGTYLEVRDNLQQLVFFFFFLSFHYVCLHQKQATRLRGRCLHLLSHLEDTCVEHVLSKLQVRPASKLRIIVLWRLYRRLRKGNSSDG